MDFQELRNKMVDQQIIKRGITDSGVIAVMRRVPRHEFVPVEEMYHAYDDSPLPIGEGQTISQPYMVALMTECLKLTKNQRVLEVGTGSGYQTAVLAELSYQVYSIERIAKLAHQAKERLQGLGYKNINFLIGDGTLGWPDKGLQFDAMLVTAASPHILNHLLDQMTPDGRMVIPIGDKISQTLTLITKKGGRIKEEMVCGCVFVPLTGEFGWN